jgi:uncharacterized protein YbjT (DUF2867 family)
MKIIITGSTGMVGKAVLLECIDDVFVSEILLVNRTPIKLTHPKIKEIICIDWFKLEDIKKHFKGYNACFFCLGANIIQSEKPYHKITHDLTLNFAKELISLNSNFVFCYVSGMGVGDDFYKKIMWNRIKKKTENSLLELPFKNCFIFRPGYIQPLKGVRSKTFLYRLFYFLFSPFYPLIKKLFPKYTTTSVNIGKAMILVTKNGYQKSYLENLDINTITQSA